MGITTTPLDYIHWAIYSSHPSYGLPLSLELQALKQVFGQCTSSAGLSEVAADQELQCADPDVPWPEALQGDRVDLEVSGVRCVLLSRARLRMNESDQKIDVVSTLYLIAAFLRVQ